ncbi:MAG: SpaA isopeptide-forming pilin-related protein [Peptostreptococcaceae bacterium]
MKKRKKSRFKLWMISFFVISILFSNQSLALEDDTSILATPPKTPTNDTFTSIGGEYTIKYILQNYNIFSFSDIEATHVVGPIITRNKAYRTQGYQAGTSASSQLIASDFSNGKSSYVGTVEQLGQEDKGKFALNYWFDKNQNPPPNLYVSLSSNSVQNIPQWGNPKYFFYNSSGKQFTSPNATGQGGVLQNDNFINFDEARSSIIAQSQSMLTNSNNIEVSPDLETGYLKIEAGKKYRVKNANRLRVVDISYPKDYHPVTNPYPYSTNINIDGADLTSSGQSFKGFAPPVTQGNPEYITARTYTKIDGKDHYYFPIILINGKQFNGAEGMGPGFEYGKQNGVIWNMPYINTATSGKRVARENLSDILGHIVAPYMEFWNYDNKNNQTSWNGGNINGGAIVEAWHGGFMESHQWSYDVDDIIEPANVDLNFKAKKNFIDGNLNSQVFKFRLELFEGSTVPNGMVNKNIPQTITSDSSGNINFLPITFNKQGMYSLRVKEEIPSSSTDNIIYDKSEYRLDITVVKNASNPSQPRFEFTTNITQVIDKDGKVLNPTQNVTDVVFNNKNKLKQSFTIKKIDAGTEILLPGAVFDLYKANQSSGVIEGNPIINNITTGADGTILISNELLKVDTLYILKETKPPAGYVGEKEIAFYIKGSDGLFPNIQNKVVIKNGETIVIENERYVSQLPNTGGKGTKGYVLLGIFMVSVSSGFFIREYLK